MGVLPTVLFLTAAPRTRVRGHRAGGGELRLIGTHWRPLLPFAALRRRDGRLYTVRVLCPSPTGLSASDAGCTEKQL